MKSFSDVIEFHGHSCPGLAIGYRVAVRALREIGRTSEDEEVVAIAENDSCAVDAIQALTGCTLGKGNLILKNHGKHVYTFAKRPSGEGVRISATFPTIEETAEEKEVWRRYTEGDRGEEVLKVVHGRKERRTKAILDAPEDGLLKVTRIRIPLPPEARIYRSIRCEACGEEVAEPMARVREGKVVCIPCFEAE